MLDTHSKCKSLYFHINLERKRSHKNYYLFLPWHGSNVAYNKLRYICAQRTMHFDPKETTTMSSLFLIGTRIEWDSTQVSSHLRNIGQWSFHLVFWEWEVNHVTLQVLFISWQIKMAMSTHCCQNNLGLSGFSTSNSFSNGCSYGMSWFRSWYQPFRPGKLYSPCNQKDTTQFWSYMILVSIYINLHNACFQRQENVNYLSILFVELQLLPLNPSQKHVRSMVPYRGNANPLKICKHVNTKIH